MMITMITILKMITKQFDDKVHEAKMIHADIKPANFLLVSGSFLLKPSTNGRSGNDFPS